MHHSTDLNRPGGSPAEDPSITDKVSAVLQKVADHFTTERPTDVMEPNELLVGVGTAEYNVCGRSLSTGNAKVSRSAMAIAPEPPAGITRGEYALHLRRVLGASLPEPALTGGAR
ncbi:hypothetical protein [Streptomyces sp. BH104]|uniref:hypothetical protein n=1 Tax=Streptomyces sp. BH104 TaxID=3410407 RepID=UPI003BB7A132